MLPDCLQRIVDEYVGKGFTACKINEVEAEWIGDLGEDEVIIRFKSLYWKWNILENEFTRVPFSVCYISVSPLGFIAVHNKDIRVYDRQFQLVYKTTPIWHVEDVFFHKDRLMVEYDDHIEGIDYTGNYTSTYETFYRPRSDHMHYIGKVVWHTTHGGEWCGNVHNHVWHGSHRTLRIDPYPIEFEGYEVCEFGEDVMVYDYRKWHICSVQGLTFQQGEFPFWIAKAYAMSQSKIVVQCDKDLIVLV